MKEPQYQLNRSLEGTRAALCFEPQFLGSSADGLRIMPAELPQFLITECRKLQNASFRWPVTALHAYQISWKLVVSVEGGIHNQTMW
jgi:hypothetical protein